MFGAMGDTQATILSTTAGSPIVNLVSGPPFTPPQAAVPGTPTTPAIPATNGDIGKRIIIYGAASSGTAIHFVSETVGSFAGTGSAAVALTIDTQGVGTKVGFAGNCSANGITWQVFGSNSAVFAGEVSVHGPVGLTPLAASDSYIETPPTYRYYRIKIVNTGAPVGVFFGTATVWAYPLGATIATYVNSGQVTLNVNAGATTVAAPGYFGTDDTAAVQAAIDTASAMVVPSASSDGGYNLWAPSGRYLISAAINHKKCVTLKGMHGGGTIFYLDAVAFPSSTAAWRMTGTFASDSAIAFFTRLEDVRIDCCHVAGSIGIFCDALQENSGLTRVTVVNWLKYGVQASSAGDPFGCVNWIVENPWIFPSNSAFIDNTVRGIVGFDALATTIIRGTVYGQGGFICGYGAAIDFSNGALHCVGQIHIESAGIGVHFNTGSSGDLQSVDTQVTVQKAVQIDAGNPVVIGNVFSQGQTAILDNIQFNTLTQSLISRYVCVPGNAVEVMAGALQINQSFPSGGPNIITLDPINFGADTQGGFLAVNSRSATFPNWIKTSTAASTKAMFLRLAAAALEVMIGAATNANGTNPATSYLLVRDDIAGILTPRLYFDTTSNLGALGFGNNLGVNRARWQHGLTGQDALTLQFSTNSGGAWNDVFTVRLDTGNIIFSNFSNFASGTVVGSGIYSGNGSPNTVVSAQPGSIYLDIAGNLWYKATGSGNTGWTNLSTSGVSSLSVTNSGTGGPQLSPAGPSTGAVTLTLTEPGASSSYSPTIGGLTSTSVSSAFQQQAGKWVDVRIKFTGTGAAAPATFTLPAATVSTDQVITLVALDGGSFNGIWYFTISGSTCTSYTNALSGHAYTFEGQFRYETT